MNTSERMENPESQPISTETTGKINNIHFNNALSCKEKIVDHPSLFSEEGSDSKKTDR